MPAQRKISFFILLGALVFLSFSIKNERYTQTEFGPAIEWNPEIQLEWGDFKAKENTVSNTAVATSSCGFVLESEAYNGQTSHRIYVRFYCNESWRDPQVKNPAVLAHEQLHFDICEIYGRKLCKELMQLKKTGKLSQKKTQALYDDMMNAYNEYQDLYDLETSHSRNEGKQEEWKLRVKKELNALKAYSAYQEF